MFKQQLCCTLIALMTIAFISHDESVDGTHPHASSAEKCSFSLLLSRATFVIAGLQLLSEKRLLIFTDT